MKSASSTRLAMSSISMSVYMLYMILFCEVAGLCCGCVGLYPHTLSRTLTHTHTYARARAHTHTHTHKCAFTQEHDMQVWGDFYTHVRTRARVHTHPPTHPHTHTHLCASTQEHDMQVWGDFYMRYNSCDESATDHFCRTPRASASSCD